MKLNELIKIYNLPITIRDKETLIKLIEKLKEESKFRSSEYIDWWILRFRNGVVYYYSPEKHDWEKLEE
jgi:hypothetical protein